MKIKSFVIRSTSKAFTLIELMLVILMISILAATALGMYKTYILRAKTTEAVQGVSKLTTGEVEYYSKNTTFLAVGPINFPPVANKRVVDFTVDPNWAHLTFNFTDPIQFSYQTTVTATNSVDCEAQGDLNGDGITSIFRRTVSFASSFTVGSLYVFDELE
ncbi:MAG: prepilin-type N-terminal cleavage/methylation domain-containing protein [Deltaproteobacteria bacterium]|nr:prepilin-type N-terminal cleavage/methylation domain-containing protein [Deltaproteobacteria bacterium]